MFKHAVSGRFVVHTRKGFTLIELLVVVSIIGMLSSIVFASLNESRRKGRIATAQGNLRNIFTVWLLCSESGSNPARPAETIDGSPTEAGDRVTCVDTSIINTRYSRLPPGWVYCDAVDSSPICTGVLNSTNQLPFKLTAKGDGVAIICEETGCRTQPTP